MIIVYTPEGQEPQHYDASTLKVSEASIVQRTVDMKWQEILEGLEHDDLDAMRGIVWVIKKRSEPNLRWGDFDPGVTEMTSRMSNREIERFIESLFAAGDTNPDLTRDMVADIVRSRVAEAAVDLEYAHRLIDKLAAESPKEEQPQEGSADLPSTSPTPTSSTPETATSPSSRTSSTSRRQKSTPSGSATSTT